MSRPPSSLNNNNFPSQGQGFNNNDSSSLAKPVDTEEILSTIEACESDIVSLLSVASDTCSLLSQLAKVDANALPQKDDDKQEENPTAIVTKLKSNTESYLRILKRIHEEAAPLHTHVTTYSGRREDSLKDKKEESTSSNELWKTSDTAGGEEGEEEPKSKYVKWTEIRLAQEKKALLEMRGEINWDCGVDVGEEIEVEDVSANGNGQKRKR